MTITRRTTATKRVPSDPTRRTATAAGWFFIITFIGAFQTGFLPARGWGTFLMWGLLFFAIALRGGGPYSLDRALGREL